VTATRVPSSALTRFVVASRYMPVYIALVVLVVVAAIWVPATLSGVALAAIAPFGALLGLAALGQMLVIMTAGIDLSVPGTITISALIVVGVGQQSDERLWLAIGTAIGVAALIGLVNGILIGGIKLNALIVTLAVLLFAVSTAISWSYYGDRATEYLFGARWIGTYRWVYLTFFFLGAILPLQAVWTFGDVALGLMSFPNLLALILLSRSVVAMTRDYFSREQRPFS